MLEVVLDTETTGLAVKDGHRIVEIGCIELENQIPTNNKFHCYLNPERKVSDVAFKIHGYSDEFLSKQKKFSEIVEDFLDFINNKKIIIHNADFDLSHINNELRLIGKNLIKKNNVIDTLEIARHKFPGSLVNLDALCKRYKIDNSKRSKHTALLDCELLTKIYVNLIDQKEPKLNFSNYKNREGDLSSTREKINYFKKIILPSQIETNLHKNFLKKSFKKNFF